jgi:heme/copper-type cytochrome/quinol oxidase subunit 3
MTIVATSAVRPPEASKRSYETGWWGIWVVIATEATVFASLLAAYFFVRAASPDWPQGGIKPPELPTISVFTVVLLASSIPLFWGESAIRKGKVGALRIALLVNFVLGVAFILNQVVEYRALEFRLSTNAYASLFIVITALHGLHVVIGLCMNVVVQLKARLGWFNADRHLTVSVFSLYWHFVDVVWIFVFSSLYLSAHIS